MFLTNGIAPCGRWYSWRITYLVGGIHINHYFRNIGKERETYAVVAITHVENFTNLVARSSYGKNRRAFDRSFSFLKNIGRKLPERHAAAAATEHLARTFYVICVLAFTDCSLHRTYQSVTVCSDQTQSVKHVVPALLCQTTPTCFFYASGCET